jgi:hypothetical protein
VAVITSIRQHINFLQTDTIIFTRDLLQHGSRVSVDMCLHRLMMTGFVKRLSPGMYVRHDCSRNYTSTELSDAKKIWLFQQKLNRLSANSPGLILSCSQRYQVEIANFAPPTATPQDSNQQAFFAEQTNQPVSWASR